MEESAAAPVETAPVETAAAPVETTAPAEVAPAPEQTANLLGSIDEGGGIQPDTSNESWLMGIDEEYRTDPSVNKYQNLNEAMKGLVNQSKVIGKKGIIKPGEDATPEEMGAYFDSLGRPAEASGYEYTPIEGAPATDPDAMSKFQNWAHEKGISQDHYQGLIEFELEIQQDIQAQFEQEKVNEASTTQMELMDEIGEVEYKALLGDAASAAKSLGLYDILVDNGLAGNKEVLKAFANARKDLGSSSMVGGEQVSTESFEVQEANIRASEGYKDHTHPNYNALEAQMDDLFKRRYPNKK